MFKGDRLRALRKQKHLTQTELGEMLGLDKSTICCYEKETFVENKQKTYAEKVRL